jgi:hypothetical protein
MIRNHRVAELDPIREYIVSHLGHALDELELVEAALHDHCAVIHPAQEQIVVVLTLVNELYSALKYPERHNPNDGCPDDA